MEVSLDKQLVENVCHECETPFCVVRGSAYDDGQPFGLYLVGLHGHSEQGRLAHLAVAVLVPGYEMPQAAAIVIAATTEQFQFSFVDWANSPWAEEYYLGTQLDREAALVSDCRSTFLHIAEHVVQDLAEVTDYLEGYREPQR